MLSATGNNIQLVVSKLLAFVAYMLTGDIYQPRASCFNNLYLLKSIRLERQGEIYRYN